MVIEGNLHYVAAIYHPPKPKYNTELFISSIEVTLDEILSMKEDSYVVLAGDFNQLSSAKISHDGTASGV